MPIFLTLRLSLIRQLKRCVNFYLVQSFTLYLFYCVEDIQERLECWLSTCLVSFQVQDKFRLDLSDEEAVHYMQSLIDESVGALFAAVVEQIHKFAQV